MSKDDKVEYAKGVKGEIDNRPKRFYSDVKVTGQDDHWAVHLDGRPLRTPEKRQLVLPTQSARRSHRRGMARAGRTH